MKLAATVCSYSSGGAGGIFAPALFVGGMLGGLVGFADMNIYSDIGGMRSGRSLSWEWAQSSRGSFGHR